MEHIYPKLSDAIAFSQQNQAVMSASDYIETVYPDVRIFMQLTSFVFSFDISMTYEHYLII